MSEAKNMTATEVREAEKAYFARKAAEQAGKPDPLQPVFDRMVDILREHDLTKSAR